MFETGQMAPMAYSGYNNESFSYGDKLVARYDIKGTLYLITQLGYIKSYNYKNEKTSVLGKGFYVDPKLTGQLR